MALAPEIQVNPFYYEAKNEIVQPNHFVACSRYFVQKWVPRLGGTAVSLVLFLRSLGYYNPLTGERRDGIQVSLREIGAACGCSDRTIQRELEKNEWLQLFVKVEPCYERTRDGRVQRLENIYRIAMDDPIAPEDEDRLAELIAARGGVGIGPIMNHKGTENTETAQRKSGRDRRPRTEDRGPTADHRPLTTNDARPVHGVSTPKGAALVSDGPKPAGEPSARQVAFQARQQRSSMTPGTGASSSEKSITDNLTPAPRQNVPTVPHSVGAPAQIAATLPAECPGKNSPAKMSPQNPIPSLPEDIQEDNIRQASSGDPALSHKELCVVALCGCGVSRKVARELAATIPAATIRQQMAALPYREAQNPAAVLVAALRDEWELPAAYLNAEKEKAERAQREEQARKAREEQKALETVAQDRSRQALACWDALSAKEKEAVQQAAVDALRNENGFLARMLEKGASSNAVEQMLEKMRERILLDRLAG